MSFLPKDYETPAGSSDFFKLQEGKNRIRIMSDALVGWEGWRDGKPFRRQGAEQNIDVKEVDIDEKYKKPKINHIWAFLVWDYESESLKYFTLTQKTIMKAIDSLVNDEDWGDPKGYDIGIEKIKKGPRTSYSVTSYPHKKVLPEITEAMETTELDAEKIFRESNDDAEDEFNNFGGKGGKGKKTR